MFDLLMFIGCMVTTNSSGGVEELDDMTSKLGVENEDVWEENEEIAKEFGEQTLISRMVAKPELNGSLSQSIFHRMWKNILNWKVKQIDEQSSTNVFKVTFEFRKDAKAVLDKQPWIFNGRALILDKWPTSGDWRDARALVVDIPVQTEGNKCGRVKRRGRFHFEEAWCKEEGCKEIVEKHWNGRDDYDLVGQFKAKIVRV
ncbi:hypothetical protein F8388_024187 [Cannabis sativa]|uniref:DUF4283 domain-containing protein n=1 Tax=Cannabis sativa TaxID=3483 RepID=A0A7J6FXW0_CANSA|nr:hypothetical protein F8388_024187 [Cannabis sativa]